jgi:hypothetical protein
MGRWDCFSAGNETLRDASKILPSFSRNTLQSLCRNNGGLKFSSSHFCASGRPSLLGLQCI